MQTFVVLAVVSYITSDNYYMTRGNCVEAERRRVWSESCPRCQDVPGAGVCPAPGTLENFMLLFNRTYVLCFSPETCRRHRRGYWSPEVHARMTVFDGHDLDKKLLLPPRASGFLGSFQKILLSRKCAITRRRLEFA